MAEESPPQDLPLIVDGQESTHANVATGLQGSGSGSAVTSQPKTTMEQLRGTYERLTELEAHRLRSYRKDRGADTWVSNDSQIEDDAVARGRTIVAGGSKVEGDSTVISGIILDGTTVSKNALVSDSILYASEVTNKARVMAHRPDVEGRVSNLRRSHILDRAFCEGSDLDNVTMEDTAYICDGVANSAHINGASYIVNGSRVEGGQAENVYIDNGFLVLQPHSTVKPGHAELAFVCHGGSFKGRHLPPGSILCGGTYEQPRSEAKSDAPVIKLEGGPLQGISDFHRGSHEEKLNYYLQKHPEAASAIGSIETAKSQPKRESDDLGWGGTWIDNHHYGVGTQHNGHTFGGR